MIDDHGREKNEVVHPDETLLYAGIWYKCMWMCRKLFELSSRVELMVEFA